jgi:hypothetical protein
MEVITALKWRELDDSYQKLAPRFGTWRGSTAQDVDEAIEIYSAINALKEKHYRVIACLIVRLSGSEREIWQQLQRLSDDAKPVPSNLTLYLICFCANLFATILVAREVSIFFYLHYISSQDKVTNLDVDRLKFWFLVSLLIYLPPIAFMFTFRSVLRNRFPFNAKRYWLIYLSFGVFAFATTIFVLPELSFAGDRPLFLSQEYFERVSSKFWWGFMPCFLTGVIAFKMDSPASANDQWSVMFLDRIATAVICAFAGGLFSFLGAVGAANLSPGEKFVVVCTVTLLGLTSGWLSRFKTDSIIGADNRAVPQSGADLRPTSPPIANDALA